MKRKLPVFPRDALLAEQVAAVRATSSPAGQARSLDRAVELAVKAADRAPAVAREARGGARGPTVACREGCAHCCRQRVVAYAPEVLRLARAIAALPEEPRRAVTSRVTETDELLKRLPSEDRPRARFACPLLVDETCMVHEARPLACRGQNSLDARLCERRLAGERDVPESLDEATHLAHAHVGAALGAALVREGLDGHPLELVAALRIALDRENAGDRWASGMPVFAQARAIEAGGTR